MRKLIFVLLTACAVMASAAAMAHGGRVSVGVYYAPPMYVGPAYTPYYRPYYYPAPVYYTAPMYVERRTAVPAYALYCNATGEYYRPEIRCTGGWDRVPVR
jgi:hypothetical protein